MGWNGKKRKRAASKKGVRKYLGAKPQIIQNPSTAIPNSTVVKLRYSDAIDLNSAVAPMVVHVFRGASINDPDLTGAGHQPRGHDEWANFYHRYRVLQSTIMVDFRDTNNSVQGHICGVSAMERSTALTGFAYRYLEQPYTKYIGNTVIEAESPRISKTMKSEYFEGVTDVYVDNNYTADVNTNPAKDWYWHIFAASLNGTTTVGMRATVTIVYTVQFFERQDLGDS